MSAGPRCRPVFRPWRVLGRPRRPGDGPGVRHDHPDAGFTLVEMLVSVAVIGIVMTALTAFYVTTLATTRQQSGRQAAVHLADDATERVRAMQGSALVTGRDQTSTNNQWTNPVTGVAPYLAQTQRAWDATARYPDGATAPLPTSARTVTVNGLRYAQYWYLGTCTQPASGGDCDTTAGPGDIEFYRVVVAVTWYDRACTGLPDSRCSYVTSTLVSPATGDPVFDQSTVGSPPAVDSPGDQVGEVTVPVNLQLTASGGTAPLIWSETGLPAGLTLSSAGLVSGSPTAPGLYRVTARLTDTLGLYDETTFSWTVNDLPALTDPGDQITAGGVPVSLPITVTGGTAPMTWAAAPGAWGPTGLPEGLTIDPATGVISGTPTAVGPAADVTVTVTDHFGKSASTTFTWAVPPLQVQTPAPQTGTEGDPVSLQIIATGGIAPYTWSATGLPDGLTIDPATGVVSGTPTTNRTYHVTVTVRDNDGTTESTASFRWHIGNGHGHGGAGASFDGHTGRFW